MIIMSNNILQAEVSIKGTRALLWHAFGPDAIPLEKQERTGVAGNDPEEWKKSVLYLPETRQLYLNPTYIFGCLREASKHSKRGRGTLQVPLCATLQVVSELVLIDRHLPSEPLPTSPTYPVYLDITSVRNPATKARNVRYRVAAAKGWQSSFIVMWDKTIVSRAEMETICIDAGRLCGLGDGRSVGYGRFEVLKFSVIEHA